MGVPKFYRFISERYPLINAPLRPSSAPKIDNLYLDMNGIIHNCVRTVPGNGGLETNRYSKSLPPATKSHQQIFLDVFKYIDNLFTLITPSRVLYMAVDGVAPRAKMNQQRARRFRSAKERLDEHARMMEADPMYAAAQFEPFDSNCITPGTHFMYKLTEALKYFVTKKLTEDINWAHIDVVLSGAEAPGEGEHKIMAYIRAMRESGRLPANTRHCVYGLDADLIMLGLVTHEPHFFILREKVDFSSYRKKKGGPRVATALDTMVFGEFELLSIGLLREYLVLELGTNGNCELPYFDVERITDDIVFILMLIGNDFLPNLPTLDIADGTLHVMLHLYKRVLPRLGGYLTEMGEICGSRLEYFLAKLGLLEEDVLRQKMEDESSGSGRRNRRGTRGKTFANTDLDQLFGISSSNDSFKPLSYEELRAEAMLCREKMNRIETLKNNYYSEKFGLEFGKDSNLKRLTKAYVEGIAWTLKYYTEGCRQWRWFYPEHYAPLASDMSGIVETLARYEDGIVADQPFRPFEQLMSVLPPISSWCLPSPYQMLMNSPASPIRDQYPEDFRTDINGKRNEWEAVVLLPFVDEDRLLKALHGIPREALSREEAIRNEFGPSYLYRRDTNSTAVMESPFEMYMPSFVHQTRRRNLILPKILPGQPFTAALLPGTKSAKSSKDFADLPTLNEVKHSSRLEAVGVNVFGTPSKSDSLVLGIDFDLDNNKGPTTTFSSNRTEASILDKRGITTGSAVWSGYPWRVAGLVESIANECATKHIVRGSQAKGDQAEAPRMETRTTNKENFARDVSVVASTLLQKYAISVSTLRQVVAVRQVGDSIMQSARKKEDIGLYHDHFITLRSSDCEVETDANGHSKQLVKGLSVLYVGHGCYFGHRASVVSQRANGMVRIQFDMSDAAAKEPAFGYRVVSDSRSQERWMSLSKLAGTVGMKVSLVDEFLGSLRVKLNNGKDEADLGLGVKYIGRRLYVPGYARPDSRSHFLFSRKCADLLCNYEKAFPSLFAAVAKVKAEETRSGERIRGIIIFEAKNLFSDFKNPDEAAKTVSTWISTQDIASLPLVSTKADILTREAVFELEKHCSIAHALQQEFDEVSRKVNRGGVMRDVDRDSLLTGHEPLEWDTDKSTAGTAIYHAPVKADASDLRLGDRVVNRMGSGCVPFGLRGTVIGIHPLELADNSDEEEPDDPKSLQAFVEVCFDEGFIGGSSLSNRCHKGRGKVVPATSVIIIRPDCDKLFYAKNYARVAARVGLLLKQNSGKDDNLKKNTAIADAAVKSYATAVKKHLPSTTRVPFRATGDIAADKRLSIAPEIGETAPDNALEETHPVVGNDIEVRPENLPLPSFIRPLPSLRFGMKHSIGQFSTSTGLSKRQYSTNVQFVRGEREDESGGTQSEMNGNICPEASLIEEQLKEALEEREFVEEQSSRDIATVSRNHLRGSSSQADRYGAASEQQTALPDEDEFAAIWRRLQISREKRNTA